VDGSTLPPPEPPTAVLMIRNMGVEGTPSVMLQVTTPSIFQTRDPGDKTNW
jgi:hypothetical protein